MERARARWRPHGKRSPDDPHTEWPQVTVLHVLGLTFSQLPRRVKTLRGPNPGHFLPVKLLTAPSNTSSLWSHKGMNELRAGSPTWQHPSIPFFPPSPSSSKYRVLTSHGSADRQRQRRQSPSPGELPPVDTTSHAVGGALPEGTEVDRAPLRRTRVESRKASQRRRRLSRVLRGALSQQM